LSLLGLRYEHQKVLPVRYKGIDLECGYRMDLVVEAALVVEIKAVEWLLPVHAAQVITYLKLSGLDAGLLVNFHAETLKQGLRRLSRTKSPPSRLPASL
jgi:GxxExxY protein